MIVFYSCEKGNMQLHVYACTSLTLQYPTTPDMTPYTQEHGKLSFFYRNIEADLQSSSEGQGHTSNLYLLNY